MTRFPSQALVAFNGSGEMAEERLTQYRDVMDDDQHALYPRSRQPEGHERAPAGGIMTQSPGTST